MNFIPREALMIWLPGRSGQFIIKLISTSPDIWKGVRRFGQYTKALLIWSATNIKDLGKQVTNCADRY